MDSNHIKSLAGEVMTANAERNRMLSAMDDFYQGRWELPEPLSRMSWIHKVVTTDPHDAVRAGTRVLSSLNPNIKIYPMLNDEENKIKANQWEQQLKWYFINASLRRRATVLSDVVMSALLYDMIAIQVTYLPYQAQEEKALKGDGAILRNKMRNGPFVITVHNPQNVYALDSQHGLEGVLSVRVARMHELASEWGNRANELLEYAGAQADKSMDWVTIYDYWDNETRYVWGIPGETMTLASAQSAGGVDILPPYKHNLGWIPWVVRQGGTTLFHDNKHRLNPMLYSIYQSGQWDTQNVAETLAVSEVISYASAPRGVISGPSKDGVVRDFGEPGNLTWEKPGHQYRPESPPSVDAGMFTVVDRIASRIDKSTVARILQNADIAPNTAFSTLNLATQTALGALKPYKHLAEVAVGDILTSMLLWIKHSGSMAVGYGVDAEFEGQQLTIDPDEIEPDQIYIDVELQPDVPTDRLQRINAGRILQSMGVSVRRSLEEAGISDPEQAIAEGYHDKMLDHFIGLELERENQGLQLEFQQAQMELQMGLQQQVQQQQAQQAQAQQAQQAGTSAEGLAASPNQGGLPAAQFAPEQTREQVTGEDRTGGEF